jgi:hypothetical protein
MNSVLVVMTYRSEGSSYLSAIYTDTKDNLIKAKKFAIKQAAKLPNKKDEVILWRYPLGECAQAGEIIVRHDGAGWADD